MGDGLEARLELLERLSKANGISDLIGHFDMTILVTMSAVSISELKANLSRYVREVRRGGEVEVLDRGVPVARMIAARGGGDERGRERLIALGVIRPGRGNASQILHEPLLELPVTISDALIEDRADRL